MLGRTLGLIALLSFCLVPPVSAQQRREADGWGGESGGEQGQRGSRREGGSGEV